MLFRRALASEVDVSAVDAGEWFALPPKSFNVVWQAGWPAAGLDFVVRRKILALAASRTVVV
jgi:hypothetical protein